MGSFTSSLHTTATATRDFTLGLDFLRNWEVVADDTPRSTVTESYLAGTPAVVLSTTTTCCQMVVDGKSFSVTPEQFRKGWTLHQVKKKVEAPQVVYASGIILPEGYSVTEASREEEHDPVVSV